MIKTEFITITNNYAYLTRTHLHRVTLLVRLHGHNNKHGKSLFVSYAQLATGMNAQCDSCEYKSTIPLFKWTYSYIHCIIYN